MFNPVKNATLIAGMAWKMSKGKKEWSQQTQAYIQPYIQQALTDNDGSLTQGVLHKLKDYPLEGLFAAQLMADLHEYSLSEKAQRHIGFCGAILALGDVFCDDTNMSYEQVQQMLEEPHQCKANSTIEKLFVAIYKDLLIELDDKWQVPFHKALMQGFEAEKQSRFLRDNISDRKKVNSIIQEKGGRSLLIYRSLIRKEMVSGEEEALWLTGAFTQLIDDVFDLYWDFRKHTQTSATECPDFTELSHQLQEHFQKMQTAFRTSEFPHDRAYTFLFVFNIFLRGVELYITQLKQLSGIKIQPETLLALSEQEIKFKQLSLSNVVAVLPSALSFSY
ncbi:MAG: hypothetical protein WC150_05190 [Bacteroidia bacterium]